MAQPVTRHSHAQTWFWVFTFPPFWDLMCQAICRWPLWPLWLRQLSAGALDESGHCTSLHHTTHTTYCNCSNDCVTATNSIHERRQKPEARGVRHQECYHCRCKFVYQGRWMMPKDGCNYVEWCECPRISDAFTSHLSLCKEDDFVVRVLEELLSRRPREEFGQIRLVEIPRADLRHVKWCLP